jgi:hypothetical protein
MSTILGMTRSVTVVLSIFALMSAASADSFGPYSNSREVEATGKYYVVATESPVTGTGAT